MITDGSCHTVCSGGVNVNGKTKKHKTMSMSLDGIIKDAAINGMPIMISGAR